LMNPLRLISVAICVFLQACSLPPPGAGISPEPLPQAESPGAKLLQQHCANCHGAPLPNTHSAEVWPSVVYRMQTRIITKAYQPLTELEVTTLIEYLQRNAGGES